jgi:predicted component of type VI protein secretion system
MAMVTNEHLLGELAKARGLVLEGLTRSVRARALLEHEVEIKGPVLQDLEDSSLDFLRGLEDMILFGLRVDT